MGCEGYLTIARVVDGHHLLEDSKLVWFRVTEPIGIIPATRSDFGGRSNFTTHGWDHVVGEDNVAWLPRVSYPYIGLLILPMSTINIYCEHEKKLKEEGSSRYKPWETCLTAGGRYVESLIPTWEKIIPGFWVVRRYDESGMGERSEHYSTYSKDEEGITFGESLRWELWT